MAYTIECLYAGGEVSIAGPFSNDGRVVVDSEMYVELLGANEAIYFRDVAENERSFRVLDPLCRLPDLLTSGATRVVSDHA